MKGMTIEQFLERWDEIEAKYKELDRELLKHVEEGFGEVEGKELETEEIINRTSKNIEKIMVAKKVELMCMFFQCNPETLKILRVLH